MIFDRLRRAAPRLRAAFKSFVRELANDPADVVRQPEIGFDRFALAAKLSHVYCYRFELVDGDLANAKATFVNVWESLGYDTPPAVASFQEAFAMVVLPEDQARAGRDVVAALSGETPTFLSEYRVRHTDGSIHWNLARGIVLRDGDGNPTELLGTAVDITDLKQVQEDARRARDRMELAVVGSKTCVWDAELDPVDFLDSKIQFTNVAEILGYEAFSHPQTWRAGLYVFPEDDREAFSRGFAALLASDQRTWETTMRVIHRDGTLMTFLFRGVITRDSSGRATRLTGISMDITQYDKLAEELARAKDRLELAVVGSKAAVWDITIDPDDFLESSVHHTNIPEILGYDPATFPTIWRDTLFVYHEDDRPQILESVVALLQSDIRSWETPIRLRHRDGTVMTLLLRCVITRNASGKATRATGLSLDVTEREVLAAELQLAKDRLELGLRSSGLGLFDVRLPTATTPEEQTLLNVYEPLGYETGSNAVIIFDEDRPALAAARQHWFESADGLHEIEHRHRHRDGSERWKLARGVMFRNREGAPERLVGCLIDITERKRMEKTLKGAEQRFRRVFDNAAVGIAITDPEANFLEINDRLCRFYGYPMEEAMHFRIDDRSLDGAEVEKERIRAVASGEVETMTSDKRFRRKDGKIVWHQLTASALLRDEHGRATEMLGIVQDITARKTLELELLAAREAAESANRAKDEFLAHVSHEIRTPMNAILGMTELALDCTGEHQHQLLRTARSAAGNLLDIINDLLDFSKIGAGKLSLHVVDFSLRTMLADLVRALVTRADAKRLSLRHGVGDDVPDVLRGDEGRLRQILLNLLGNAIKFTQAGEVRLTVRALERTPEHAILAFDVHDSGIGIAPDRQGSVFQAFEQADVTTTRKYGGTGLGLTISAQLAELMGGSIAVTSEVGRGSTFVLTIPFAVGVASVVPTRHIEAERTDVRLTVAPRVLVAEDNELNVAVVREILRQRGYRADYASDGRVTLECLEHSSYDLLLLDLHMPEIDGFGVVRAVRERERETGAHLPIIALTARSSQNDREKSLVAGMDEFLGKPIEVSALWAAVDRVFATYPPLPRRASLLDREPIMR
jgi:two-component system, sensor histidine kinase and response regulator